MEDNKLPKELSELKELKPVHKIEPTVTVKKSTVWQGLCVALVILLALSVWTGGFGFGKETTGAATATQIEKIQVSADGAPILGSKSAQVTIIEFSDFQCSYCSRGKATVDSLIDKYVTPGKVNVAFKNFPLGFHPNAKPAAEAAEAAEEQGKFWEMYNKIFDNQAAWSSLSDPKTVFKGYATDIGLDVAKWEASYDSSKYDSEITKEISDGSAAGVSGTPTFFLVTAKTSKNDLSTQKAVEALRASVPDDSKDMYKFFYSEDGKELVVRLVGAQPATAFEPVLDAMLA